MVFTRNTHLPKKDDDAKKKNSENEEKKMRASALRGEDMRSEKYEGNNSSTSITECNSIKPSERIQQILK